jgi:antitoxin ParD1/3/4
MSKLNVSLPQELADFVQRQVAGGGYGDASEVVGDALRLLRREAAAHDEKLAILRREIEIGVQQARDGRLSKRSISEIAAALDAKAGRPA